MTRELKTILRAAYQEIVIRRVKPVKSTGMLAAASSDVIREARTHMERIKPLQGQCFIAKTEAQFLAEALPKNG